MSDRAAEMQISEGELSAMTRQLDELHREHWTRRRLLTGGLGAVVGAFVLAACTEDTAKNAADVVNDTAPTTTPSLVGDLRLAALAASLENLAATTYQAGIDAATAGRLGAVPPAVVTFAQTAQSQHRDHAAAWNAILTGAGKPRVTGVDLTVKPIVDQGLAQLRDVPSLARVVLSLENAAAATYLSGLGVLVNKKAVQTAASIQPVEMQHAAILSFILGQYPVPDSVARLDGARPPSDTIGT